MVPEASIQGVALGSTTPSQWVGFMFKEFSSEDSQSTPNCPDGDGSSYRGWYRGRVGQPSHQQGVQHGPGRPGPPRHHPQQGGQGEARAQGGRGYVISE